MGGGVGHAATEKTAAGGWRGHLWAARLVQGFIVVAPIAAGVAASYLLARLLPAAEADSLLSKLTREAPPIEDWTVGSVFLESLKQRLRLQAPTPTCAS